jgi:hypothetical protein
MHSFWLRCNNLDILHIGTESNHIRTRSAIKFEIQHMVWIIMQIYCTHGYVHGFDQRPTGRVMAVIHMFIYSCACVWV